MNSEQTPRPSGGRVPNVLIFREPVLDIGVGLLFLAMAAWMWVGAADIDTSAQLGLVGPATFPRGFALILGALALVMTVQAAVRVRSSGLAVRMVKFQRPVSVLAAVVIVAVYPYLLTRLGYFPATALWLPPLFWAAGFRRPIAVLAWTAGFLLFTKLLFEMVLGTPLP